MDFSLVQKGKIKEKQICFQDKMRTLAVGPKKAQVETASELELPAREHIGVDRGSWWPWRGQR